jgi:ubiquinone/menaquinone biosynthesis C-methylase UbiE
MTPSPMLEVKLPTLHELPTYVFDTLLSWNIPGLTRSLVGLYGRPDGWLGRLIGHVMSFEHGPVTHWTLEQMDIQPRDRVLDVGCGAGKALELLAHLAPRGFVVGLDHSETMVFQALSRNRARVLAGQLSVRMGDVGRMPFADASFDKVCAIETLYFWPEPKAALEEIHRVLVPGGRVALSLEYTRDASRAGDLSDTLESSAGVRIYSSAEVLELLEAAGFTALRHEAQPSRSNGWLYVEGRKPGH